MLPLIPLRHILPARHARPRAAARVRASCLYCYLLAISRYLKTELVPNTLYIPTTLLSSRTAAGRTLCLSFTSTEAHRPKTCPCRSLVSDYPYQHWMQPSPLASRVCPPKSQAISPAPRRPSPPLLLLLLLLWNTAFPRTTASLLLYAAVVIHISRQVPLSFTLACVRMLDGSNKLSKL